ncbi:MAG: YvcK family protein [Candidatus Melainabacteria bacterium]|nr:YvcK family protein [Candidatus Melainabacteria bacterium]
MIHKLRDLNLRRYSLPGLKKWILIGFIGFIFGLLGVALLLELRPVTRLRDLTWLIVGGTAKIIPTYVSGTIGIVVCIFLITYAVVSANKEVVRAIAPELADSSFLDALDKLHSLSRGAKVVAIGGGTGLSTLLSGLKHFTTNITAIVTVADDGGSSGRLREELGIIPPGDIRNCIAALADEDKMITELFQYRFKTGQNLEGHSFGNLFLTALQEVSGGDFIKAVKAACLILRSRGTVLPSSPEPMKIIAELHDGRIIEGESRIPQAKGRIKRIFSERENPKAQEEAINAISEAELIIFGPGSLYTSIIPNLLAPEIVSAIKNNSNAHKVYVCNIMTQPGETSNYTVSDHINALLQHAKDQNLIDVVIVNDRHPKLLLEKYKEKGQEPVVIDADIIQKLGIRIVARNLIKEEDLVRHNPKLLARAIMLWHKRWLKYPVKKQVVSSK